MPRSRHPDVTLLVPGLFERLPSWRADYDYRAESPALELLFSRGSVDRLPASGYEDAACALFGMERRPGQDLPIAALSYPLDHQGTQPAGFCLRADPVYLEAGIRELVLQPNDDLDITQAEAEALIALLNGHFAEDGLRFEMGAPDRWYLLVDSTEQLATWPLSAALGRDVNPLLPSGTRTAFWHSRLNELQMLLHQAPVNEKRQARGARPINSVWLWGAGPTPGRLRGDWSHVWSDSFLVRGLALAAGAADRTLPAGATEWLAELKGGNHLLVLEDLLAPSAMDEQPRWADAFWRLNREWFEPLVSAVKRGRIHRLTVVGSDGLRASARHHQMRRFWRRRRELGHYCALAQAAG